MWHFLNHWIYEDLWVPVWPNWFAGIVVGGLAFVWGKKEIIKFHKHLDRNHAELKAHIVKVHNGGKKK